MNLTKPIVLGIVAWILMLAGIALAVAAMLGLLEISSFFDGWFDQAFWLPAVLAVAVITSSRLFLKASNIALDLAHARLRIEASGNIKAAIERMSQK
ncbi:hypothetical protein [Stutzerimonas stutzeri]|uniref:hypothetical protein n=1 Tax=Stutzerimonas stutzeri TaxID=316 RepID=UPI00265D24BC|nr:hypothetical protein [Stutzerimonas stutzeri]MCF6783947.1 hypothetical protein [Stutzerimonas stutzeri]